MTGVIFALSMFCILLLAGSIFALMVHLASNQPSEDHLIPAQKKIRLNSLGS